MHLTFPSPALPADIFTAHEIILELRAQLARLESLAMLDPLTCIANRRAFDDHLSAAYAHAQRTRSPLAVAVLDVDNFKLRNDTWGHADGDRCLTALAAQLTAHSRRADTVARIGGEEFALILPNTSEAEAAEICQRIAATVRNSCGIVPLTFSAGVAHLDSTMADASTIVDYADRAMYQAKQAGKDRVFIHQPRFRRSVFKWK